MTITFADNKTFEVKTIEGRKDMTDSASDIIANSDREIMKMIFDGAVCTEDDIRYYYENPDNCSKIIITDDEGGIFEHLDYMISVKFSKVYNADGTCEINLIMAQLTEVDKTLREVAGKVIYVGTELDIAKQKKIDKSKIALAEWLKFNPMLYSEGKYYSVTEEKQSLLNSNLASYERATNAGIPYPLKWNATGEECTEWEYDDLLTLSLAIAAYVAPKVAKQQAIEIAINACDSIEAVEAVRINYDNT